MHAALPSLIAIVGPTASGKSSLALETAASLGAEILSADSMQVYRGMDIGTAKPTHEERSRVLHHAIDVADPREPFSVADYCRIGAEAIGQATEQQKPLVICGGTGLYLKALFEGLAEAPAPDYQFRSEMEALAGAKGTLHLHERLRQSDPNAASKIHPNDRKRIIRALEIHHVAGLSKSEFEAAQQPPSWAGRVLWFGVKRTWNDLDARIDARVDQMFRDGLVEEVRRLAASGCTKGHTSMKALGYKEVLEHFKGERELEETLSLIKQRTRRFARRQMTWFRPNQSIEWLEADPSVGPEDPMHRLRERILAVVKNKSNFGAAW